MLLTNNFTVLDGLDTLDYYDSQKDLQHSNVSIFSDKNGCFGWNISRTSKVFIETSSE